MKDISLKVYNATKNTGEMKFTTDDDKPTIIKAQKGVNYEFYDHSIDRAPNHIITKRDGKDLYISFEEKGKNTDLIIENFYDNEQQALIGIAEDGQYYYYIPDTAEVQDYVTQLKNTDIEGHALGGEHLVAPLWIELPSSDFPWWIGLGLVPLLFVNKDDNNDNDNDRDSSENSDDNKLKLSVEPKIPKNAQAGDEVTYFLEIKNTGKVAINDVKITNAKLGLNDVAITDTKLKLVSGKQDDAKLEVGESIKVAVKYELTQADLDSDKIETSTTVKGTDSTGKEITTSITSSSQSTETTTDNNSIDSDKPNGQIFSKVSIDGAKTVDENAGKAEYTLQLDKVSTEDVTITLKMLAGRANSVPHVQGHTNAKDGEDFTSDTYTVTIPKGKTTATVSVPIIDDNKAETPEDYTIYIDDVKGGTITDDADKKLVVTTINDNDIIYQINTVGDITIDSTLSNIIKLNMDNGTKQNLKLSANDVIKQVMICI